VAATSVEASGAITSMRGTNMVLGTFVSLAETQIESPVLAEKVQTST